MDPLLRFDDFMRRALHDPETGYYARRIRRVGRGGDFTTTPMISQAPARAIAAWVLRAVRETGVRHLIEVGPGQGTLAREVLDHLPWWQRLNLTLHLVESSVPLAAAQAQQLRRRARYHRGMEEALDACRGRALIYSNELVDAFPVRRFRREADGWSELFLRLPPGQPAGEVLVPQPELPDSSHFAQDHPRGQWIEVHQSYQDWLLDWMPAWQAGQLLTIDYGGPAATLLHRRPMGTIRGYFHQQRIAGPAIYANPGWQDLTADVNFTDLIRWSAPWTTESQLLSFRQFLAESIDARRANDRAVIDDHGAGEAFQVLIQKR